MKIVFFTRPPISFQVAETIFQKINASNKMKSFNFFLTSALCFLVANNLHFVVDGGFIPKILDIIATGFFIWGFYKIFTE